MMTICQSNMAGRTSFSMTLTPIGISTSTLMLPSFFFLFKTLSFSSRDDLAYPAMSPENKAGGGKRKKSRSKKNKSVESDGKLQTDSDE